MARSATSRLIMLDWCNFLQQWNDWICEWGQSSTCHLSQPSQGFQRSPKLLLYPSSDVAVWMSTWKQVGWWVPEERSWWVLLHLQARSSCRSAGGWDLTWFTPLSVTWQKWWSTHKVCRWHQTRRNSQYSHKEGADSCRLEECGDRNLVKFTNHKWNVLHLGLNNPWLHCQPGAAQPGSSTAEKNLGVVESSDLGTSHSLPGTSSVTGSRSAQTLLVLTGDGAASAQTCNGFGGQRNSNLPLCEEFEKIEPSSSQQCTVWGIEKKDKYRNKRDSNWM